MIRISKGLALRLQHALAVALCVLAGVLAPVGAKAELRIDITRGSVKPLPIAITNFVGNQSDESQFGRDIAKVISANLERSGLFKPISQKRSSNRRAPSIHCRASAIGVSLMHKPWCRGVP